MGAIKPDVARKPLTPGALGHGMIDPKECPAWSPAKNQHALSTAHGGRKPQARHPGLKEAPDTYKGSGDTITMELPNSFDEMKRACAKTFGVNDVRVFHGGKREVTSEADYRQVGVGHSLVIAGADGQPIGFERRRADPAPRVEFTAISESQANYVPKVHGQPGVFYPGPYKQKEWRQEWLEQREREAATKEPPRPQERAPKYPDVFGEPSTAALDRHAAKLGDQPDWTAVGRSERVESEMREKFKAHEFSALAKPQDRKTLTASDFSLFQHQPAGKVGKFEGRSESQTMYVDPRTNPKFEPPRRGVPELAETEGARRLALRRQNLQNPKTEPKNAWWTRGKFTGTSEMQSHYTTHTGKLVGDCKPVRGVFSDWSQSEFFQRKDVVYVEPCKLVFKGQ